MLRDGLPDRQSNQQKHADDSDPDARLGEPRVLANPTVNERPNEHHEHDESHTQDGKCAREQLQPAERNIEEPFRFDFFRSNQGVGSRANQCTWRGPKIPLITARHYG